MNEKSAGLKTWSKIVSHSRKYSLWKNGDRVLAAVSGGPDSVCMAHFFAHYVKRHGMEAIICHVNHGMRKPGADADECFVRKLGERLGSKTIVRKISVPSLAKKMKLSSEHAARKLRYAVLSEEARKNHCSVIATAHHMDDHVETVLLNMLRGTDPRGLLGIPVKRPLYPASRVRHPIFNIFVIRPLLCLDAQEILRYLRSAGLDYRKDETNEYEKFTRNWVRKRLLPLLEQKQPKFKQHMLEFSFKFSKIITQ